MRTLAGFYRTFAADFTAPFAELVGHAAALAKTGFGGLMGTSTAKKRGSGLFLLATAVLPSLASTANIAVLAAAAGLFSVLTCAVAGRRREFGIRAAIGASPRQIRRLVYRD